MEELLFKIFSDILPLTRDDFNQIKKNLKFAKYKKGDKILDYGQIESKTGFLISGIIHQTVLLKGELITADIAISGMYFNNLKSYLEESPSAETQTAITDVEFVYIEKKDAEKLLIESHTFCYIYSKLWEKSHLEREKRTYLLQNKNALQRFELFMNTNKKAQRYLQEVPNRIIADFLNLTPETFSRVKKAFFKH